MGFNPEATQSCCFVVLVNLLFNWNYQILAGWGDSGDYCTGGTTVNTLQKVDMQIMPNDICRQQEGYYNRYNKTLGRCVTHWYSLKADWWGTEKVEDHILCAKNPSKNTSTCQGDSGGPLTVKQNDQHFLVGITQSGYGCGLVSF